MSRPRHIASSLSVVLVNPRNSLNMGAAARAMSNFGFTDLRLVNPYEVAYQDLLAEDEVVSAVGPSKKLLQRARVYPTLREAIADATYVVGTASLGNRHLELDLKRLETGGATIKRRVKSGKVALLFGSERFGLTNDELAACHFLMRIPTRAGHESMNLGQAVAICLYELVRAPRAAAEEDQDWDRETVHAAPPPGLGPAQGQAVDRVTEMLTELLEESGYVKKRVQTSTHLKIRRMIRRWKLNATDAQNLLGMLKKIRWKMGL